MVRISFVVVDRTRSPFLREGEKFYLARLKPYAQTAWIVVKPEKISKNRTDEQVMHLEGKAIIQHLPQQNYIIALDRIGRMYSSEEFASHLEALFMQHSRITFFTGGPLGLSPEVRGTAHECLSLSRLTLTHEMSRLFLLEQIYRAFTIIHGTKYHK